MLEFNQLRCFVTLAEELHFGRAASRLHMTQAPLSRHLQNLEQVLGVRLLERNTRSVRLTRAGRMFLPEAKRILRLSERAALDARRGARGEVGVVRIGFTAGSGYDFLPRLLSIVRAGLPDVDLVLREMVTVDQVEALATDQLDVGLLRPPVDHRQFASLCVLREPLLVALPRSHPLARSDRLALQDLAGQPLVMYSPYEAHYFFDLVTTIFHQVGVSPDYVQHVTQIHSILALVRAELGAALVPQAAATLAPEGVVFRPLDLEPMLHAKLCLTWLLENDNPIVQAFVTLVSDQLGSS